MDDFATWTAELADRRCPDCTRTVCTRHRCTAIRASGERCKRRVGAGMELLCPTHGCTTMISFHPVPMRCSDPVVLVQAADDYTAYLCARHAAQRHPGQPVSLPNFTYPDAVTAAVMPEFECDPRNSASG